MIHVGLDIGNSSIYGAALVRDSGSTARVFHIEQGDVPAEHQLKLQLEQLTHSLGTYRDNLVLCANDCPWWFEHSSNYQERGYRLASPQVFVEVDHILRLAHLKQRAHWDRAHLIAYTAQSMDRQRANHSNSEFSLAWGLKRLSDKLATLHFEDLLHQRSLSTPDWLTEFTKAP